jgi:hypothetical protein
VTSNREVKIKRSTGLLASRKAVVTLRDKEILCEFIRPSTKQRWLEVVPYPNDGILRHDKLEQAILLDGRLSSNGGQWFTIDADRGICVDYQLGQATTTRIVKQAHLTADGKTVEFEGPVVEPVGVTEWVGIDGVQTWIYEHDLSFKQIAESQQKQLFEMVMKIIQLAMVMMGIMAFVMLLNVIVLWNVADIKLPGVGG